MAHHPPPSWQSSEGLTVAAFRHGPLWNFSYLIACEETGEAAVIDPAWDVPAILEAAEQRGLRIGTVLLTHNHSDHANGLTELLEATNSVAFLHREEAAGLAAAAVGRATTFGDSEEIELGCVRCSLWHTPGHTRGSASFYAAGRLFSGDTLTVGSPGTPGPEVDAVEVLWQTMSRLRTLPDQTLLHPGHDSGPRRVGVFGMERESNAALRANDLHEFVLAVERSTGRRLRD